MKSGDKESSKLRSSKRLKMLVACISVYNMK